MHVHGADTSAISVSISDGTTFANCLAISSEWSAVRTCPRTAPQQWVPRAACSMRFRFSAHCSENEAQMCAYETARGGRSPGQLSKRASYVLVCVRGDFQFGFVGEIAQLLHVK